MLRLSANLSMLFTDRPLPARFAAAREAGFDGVEIQFPYATPLADIRAASRDIGLPVVLLNLPAGDLMQGGPGLLAVPGREQAVREAFETALPWLDALGTPCLNLLPGRCAPGILPAEARRTLDANLDWLLPALDARGVQPVAEAINAIDMNGSLCTGIRDLRALCARHPGLGMQIDLYHMAMNGDDPAAALLENVLHISHIQFADWPGRGRPGSGTLDFARLFDLIRKLSYNGWCGAEYRDTGDGFDWMPAREI